MEEGAISKSILTSGHVKFTCSSWGVHHEPRKYMDASLSICLYCCNTKVDSSSV